jgi:antirestriction protein ArdC
MRFDDFVNSIGVNFVEYDNACIAADVPLFQRMCAAGFYDYQFDFIAINHASLLYMGVTVEEVTLHEMTHWTGHKTRLNRKSMYSHSISNRELEECIAQYGMFKLACILKLDEAVYKRALDRYLVRFPEVDLQDAEKQADIAVNYMLAIANSESQAA